MERESSFDHMVSNIFFVFQLCLGCRFGSLATSTHLSLAGSRALIHLSLPWEAGWFFPGDLFNTSMQFTTSARHMFVV